MRINRTLWIGIYLVSTALVIAGFYSDHWPESAYIFFTGIAGYIFTGLIAKPKMEDGDEA